MIYEDVSYWMEYLFTDFFSRKSIHIQQSQLLSNMLNVQQYLKTFFYEMLLADVKFRTLWLNTSIFLLMFHRINGYHAINKAYIVYEWHMLDCIPSKQGLMANHYRYRDQMVMDQREQHKLWMQPEGHKYSLCLSGFCVLITIPLIKSASYSAVVCLCSCNPKQMSFYPGSFKIYISPYHHSLSFEGPSAFVYSSLLPAVCHSELGP